jgi:hypothetical protein
MSNHDHASGKHKHLSLTTLAAAALAAAIPLVPAQADQKDTASTQSAAPERASDPLSDLIFQLSNSSEFDSLVQSDLQQFAWYQQTRPHQAAKLRRYQQAMKLRKPRSS